MRPVMIVVLLLLLPQTGWSQTYPSEPIHVIVPFAKGGNLDVTAQLIGPLMSETLGQPVVVEYRPGAGGMVGAAEVMGGKPDGYTLMMASNSTLSVGPNVLPNWPYDPTTGITPIVNMHVVPFALVVRGDSDIRSVQDLLRRAKERPGEITQAHPGTGTTNHLASELFQALTGTTFKLVPYRGTAPAMNDLVAGHVDSLFDQASTTVVQVSAGTVRALAITAGRRMAALPDTPTFAEQGVAGFEVLNFTGLVGPPGMEPAVVAKLHAAVVKALANPQAREVLTKLGVEIVASSPPEFAAFIKSDLDRWARVVSEGRIKTK